MDKLTGPQIGQLRDLMKDSFSHEDFRQLVRIKLDIRFDTEYNSSGRPFKDALFEFIEDMERLGQTSSLIKAVLEAREERADFKPRLEAIITSRTTSPSSSPPSTSIPNNLPRLQPFFGREEELKKIADALDPDSRTWGALIDGPGGMGKTSLAMRAAYDCPPEQFKRIIFVSVKDREMDDDGERSLGSFILPGFIAMLNELARELGHPDITKAQEDQRIRLLIEALRPAQALLILDNLESLPKSDRDQLFTFVKKLPQGCKAILTSRRRIGSSADTLILEKLDQTAALETLADLAKRNPLLARTSEAERITLYTQTAGKPLLLRWVAGQIGRGSCRTFTDALHFIRSCPKDNDPLEFIFGDLVQEFTSDETKILCTLTYFSLSAKIKHITDLAIGNENLVTTALRTLSNRSLVVPDQEEIEYNLVPMVADFLRHKRPEIIADAAQHLERHAHSLIVENGYEQHQCYAVIEASWPVVCAALPLYLIGPYDRLKVASDALFHFLNSSGRWDEAFFLEEQVEKKAVVAGDFLNAGWSTYFQGWIFYVRNQPRQIFECAQRANSHWTKANTGIREQARMFYLPALGHLLERRFSEAIQAFNDGMRLLQSFEEGTEDAVRITEDFVLGLIFLGIAEQCSGNLEDAEVHAHEAMIASRRIGFVRGQAGAAGNLSELALARKEWVDAEELARQALPLSETLSRSELIAANCRRLAMALVRQDRKPEAFSYAQRAVRILTALRSPDLEMAREILAECEAAV